MAWWLFQNVVVTALLAGAVALVCRLTRIGPVARHALWVIVLIKFITPPVLVWPWAAPDPLGVAALDARATTTIIAEPSTTDSIVAVDASALEPSSGVSVDPSIPLTSGSLSASDVVTATWPWVLGFWIVGSVWMMALESLRLARIARAVRRGIAGPSEIAGRVTRLSRQLGLRDIPVVTIEGQPSPAIWCVGRPRLLWPATLSEGVTDACLDGLLVHELAHVQRRDHLVGWIDLMAGVIWWWNPLFWFVRSALREQAELACDAWVISALPNGRRAYAESLLALSSAAVQGRSPALAAVIGIRANNRRVLERRLVMIMQGRASLRLSVAGLVALAVMALASLPAWATGQQPTTPPPAQPATVAQTAPAQPTTAAPVSPAPTRAQAATPLPAQGARSVATPSPATSMQHPTPAAPTVAMPTIHPVTAIPAMPSRAITVVPHVMPTQAAAAHVVVTPQNPVSVAAPTPATTHATPQAVRFARVSPSSLPADGQELLNKFDADRDVIQQEADKKVEARHAEFVKSLEVLQEQYTKAGKLDEAVAIRDYIKAGAGRNEFARIIKRK